jgi:LuxR family transcriptional regulator, maltose regulon positive regulatory protein
MPNLLPTDGSYPPEQQAANQEPLSEREIEVLAMMAQGHSNRVIGERLFISTGTVKTHAHHIFQKLGVKNRKQAILRGRQMKVI